MGFRGIGVVIINLLQNWKWRTVAILKCLNYNNSASGSPILTKYAVSTHSGSLETTLWSKPEVEISSSVAAISKYVFKQYLSRGSKYMFQIWLIGRKWASRGIKMARVYFLQNSRWRTTAILQFLSCNNSATYSPILTKFDVYRCAMAIQKPIYRRNRNRKYK